MSSSAVNNNNNQAAANPLQSNPFSQWKSTTNLDPNNTAVSNLPDEVATLIFSKMAIEKVSMIMNNTETLMDRYSLYRNIVSAKSSLTGTELEKFQRLLSMEGQALIAGRAPEIKPWIDLLKAHPMSLDNLKHFDLSDSIEVSEEDLIAFTKGCPKLATLILPDAFPSEEVMAVLKTHCPQAAIYPSAMTEDEWSYPREFMKKLPPAPQEIADFINGPRPIWEGKTASQAHMVVPRVNKIVRNIDGGLVMEPWTLVNVSKLDKATGGVGCKFNFEDCIEPDIDIPTEGFEWIVFTKDVLPGSRSQTYAYQKQLVEHGGYVVPGVIDATTCMLWENRVSANCNYNYAPWNSPSWTFTRCKEIIRHGQLIAGGLTPDGVRISQGKADIAYFSGYIAAGGIQKFSVQRQLI